MIQKNYSGARLFITDSSFGHVGVGQEDFPERFSHLFGFEPTSVVWMDQVHSPTVKWIDECPDKKIILAKTDGVLTQNPGVLLITKTADCVPILLWNKQEKIVGALHCGWKGFMAGILESFAELCLQKNIPLENFSVFLGPHLRGEHFEIQQDFIDQVPASKRAFLELRNEKTFYNLTLGVKTILNSLGVKDIEDCGVDTYRSDDYFSYRAWSQLPVDQRQEHYNTFASCIILS